MYMKKILNILAACALLCACSPRIVESVRTEIVYKDRQVRDSLYFRDSVFVSEKVKGDTVYLDKYLYKYVYKLQKTTDTLVHEKRDTTFVEVRVDKPLTFVQNVKIRAFWWLCAMSLVLAIWTFRKPLLRLLT